MPRKKLPRYPCRVDGCERISMYAKDQLCQMHYFRRMRGGTFEKRLIPKERYNHSGGYVIVRKPGHPLADKNGLVYEHRFVMYERYGEHIPNCQLCGKPSQWRGKSTHVDHINRDKKDNRACNLRILCNYCNVSRGRGGRYPKRRGAMSISIKGEKKTLSEWARHPDCEISVSAIRYRLMLGMPAEDAVFKPKRQKRPSLPRPAKHTRKNAVVAIIDGIKLTAAEWSRHPGCSVCQGTIVNRIRSGMSHFDAVFMPPRTNKGARP